MKRWVAFAMVAAALGMVAEEAGARRARLHLHHRHVVRPAAGIVVVPALVPWYYPYSRFGYWYTPPLYAAPDPAAPLYGTDPAGYSYFCPDSRSYYPDVRECPSGWLTVVPGAPGPPN